MSDKPEKIYAYPGSLIYSLKPALPHTVEYIRADLAKPSYIHNDMEHWAEEYECAMKHLDILNVPRADTNDALFSLVGRIDLAKPSEWISVEQVKLLVSLLPGWTKIVQKGLDPTFYVTLSYEGDREIKAKIDAIINLLPPPPDKETK